ncbi:MAG: TldD/PmbA family protein [Candidatus Heimdallarchaeota archaeon]
MSNFKETLNQLKPEKIIDKALKLGASYADVRYQHFSNEEIRVENKSLEEYKSLDFGGLGIRVVVNGAVGFASTSDFSMDSVNNSINAALKLAKSFESEKGNFAETKTIKFDEKVSVKTDPISVSPKEKVELLMETNKAAWISDQIKNVITIMGSSVDNRFFISSQGTQTLVQVTTIGLIQIAVAVENGKMDTTYHGHGACSGYEFTKKYDWNDFSVDLSELALRSVKASSPPPGTYPVVVDPRLVGILVHEAFGHAAEADLVFTGTSTLKDRLGEELANEQVSIIDEGTSKGGYYIPVDDEGTPKGKTVIMDKGVLKAYIHDRNSANVLAVSPTGNSRAQDFENQPLVRMTNTYIDNGDYKFNELLEGIKEGVYIKNKGSGGGQVEVGMGTFTFNGGESFMIRNGELAEPVRGVIISGAILDTLKTVDAVGNDLEISTSYFGGCGKGGQAAKVGFGGPHIRVQEMTVGGR